MTNRLLPLALSLLLLGGCAAEKPASTPPPAANPFEAGMVSAADPRAAEAGAAILRKGGSATDAAIATMLALTVVEPQSSGIGGGGLYVAANPQGQIVTIDGRETAPAAAHPKWFFRHGALLRFAEVVPGGTSVGVPGNIALAAKAHAAHGKLAWAGLFEPAIRLAEDGFMVTPRLNTMLKNGAKSGSFDLAGRALFYGPDGLPLAVGTLVKNPELAATLRLVAAEGPKAFYTGSNARAIAARVSAAPRGPAPMTEADIAAYQAKDRPPVCGQYRGHRICGMGPPSSGGTTVLAALGILDHFDLAAPGQQSPQAWHLIAEAERLAYADRARYAADADFVTVPVAGLVDPAYLAGRAALISPTGSIAKVEAGVPPGAQKLARADPAPAEEHGTSHFSVIDRAGNAVAYTSTIEASFGSGLVVGGYYLNNELTDFDMAPEIDGRLVANRVEGGKRPRSSMTPTLVFAPDGKLRLVVGAAGGPTIPAQVIRAIIGVIDWKLSAEAALALPVLVPFGPEALAVEQGSALEAMIPALTALGHGQIAARALPLKANAIEVRGAALHGAADPRSEGRAVSE